MKERSVLLALLEVTDGDWVFTVAVVVVGEEDCRRGSVQGESTREAFASNTRTGGGRRVEKIRSMAGGRCRVEEDNRTRKGEERGMAVVVAEGTRSKGVQAQSLPNLNSNKKDVGPVEKKEGGGERAGGDEASAVEDCRAYERKAQTPSKNWKRVTRSGKGKIASGYGLEAQTSSPVKKKTTTGSKKLWSILLPPSSERRQGLRSKTLMSEKDKVDIDENLEGVALGANYLAERGFSASPLFSRRYSRIWKHRFGERASTSKNEAALHNFYSDEYKEGFLGRVGPDPRGATVMMLPSTPKSESPSSHFPPSYGSISPFLSPAAPTLPNDDGIVGQISVGFPNLVLEVNQIAYPSQMTDSVNPVMPNTNPSPNQATVSQSVLRVPQQEEEQTYQRGLGSRKKRRVVKDFLRLEKPDIVMIQETKKAKCDRRFVGSVWTTRNKEWAVLPACGASGGILVIWDSKKLHSEEVVLGSFSVSVKFAVDGSEQFWLSAVYGPNSTTLRKDFWVELSDIFGLSSPCWCVGGDFNVIRRCSEKLGGARLTPSMKDLDDFIRENELIDPPLRSASFTWSNMQEHPVCKRLDRFLYSNEWEQLFPQSLQEVLPRWTSDHWPIVLETNPFKWGPTSFRFENMWLHHPSFKESFGSWWREFQGDGWEDHKFMRKLQFLKAKLKEWNKNSFGDLIERRKSILLDIANFDSMEQEGGLSPELLIQRAIRKGELEELILREEIHWRQKVRVLENERGLVMDNSESIKEEILRYFEKLYASPSGESWRVEGLDWSSISREMFQDCWDVIKEDLVRVFDEFHRSGIINQSTNASFIVLLPKKSMAKKISDYRPISLITSLYKIIAKVLAGRLRGILHETIHSTQGAFVQGRQILDAVLIANEIVDEKKRSGEEGVVFKIDFEKAYDHVSWDFLDHVMEKKGFNPRWRKWIRGCLSSVSFAILVNGNAKGWIKASRGLRQGDPLSPFLFTIVADVLSRMLLRAEERNVFEGFRVGRNRTRVSHLQFADDIIFFSSTREEDLLTLKSVLLVFGHVSGLKVNLDKSNIYGINLGQDHLHRLAELLDCKASGWPILYLGLPLGGNPKSGSFWDPVIERISSRLDGVAKGIPASVAVRIERLQRDFLWSGVGEGKRDHLVSWDVVCKSKMKGGLGLGRISLRNSALLGKWLWRYPREGLTLWHQVILSIYGSHSNGWDANTVVRWRWGKNSVLGRLVVGDQPLGVRFPRLLRVVMDKNIPISSILGSTRPFSWNFNFHRNLSDSEIEDLESLMRSLDHIHLSPSVPDKRSWSLSSSELFTVKSFFLALSQISGLPSVFPTKLVWNSQVPFKIKSFVWLVAHKKVNTNDMLQLRRPYKAISPDICMLCMKQGETVDHLFLHCPLTMGLWYRLFQLTKIDWVPPRSIFDMLSTNFNGFGSSKRGIVLWQAACIALLWVVWRERNARIFEGKTRNLENLWDMIHFLASLWVSCSKVFKGIPLNVIHLDWLAACNSIGLA
ncbi:LINE-1 retrotransposable element ORF2 protein [Vitis vinifera]|uniref:LINE-1 retrotransposable element ORF2 protein n=1 Tax=Vitis vinifera TaxID=29760 RepID=A0A438I862_VITVI|nr:LINE-1 retrotransposable element ORF2 protein [Vitis vinifera]